MSAALVLLLYLASIIAVIMGAQLFADQYGQPWVPYVVAGACAFVTARYTARGIR